MKRSILMMFSTILLIAVFSVQSVNAQDKKPNWPGVTFKHLVDNAHVTVMEVTFAPGAVADWHTHPPHTIYAMTDVNMKVEEKGKENATFNLKAGEAVYSPAVEHKTSNIGKEAFKVLVTEIKDGSNKK